VPKNSTKTGNLGAATFAPGAFKDKPYTRETFMRDLKKVAAKRDPKK
jgi:hypothetical protein